MASQGHKQSASLTINQKAQLANAYNELGKELSSQRLRMVGNYTLGKVIGEGSFGTVRMGTHRLTATRVAIKQVPKSLSAHLTREIHHHRRLHHPHVTQLYEIIATENYIWLVTELCSGGELYDYLIEKGRLGEEETRIIFGQLCLAVGYIHNMGVVHRDLKLENVLLDERCRVKLSDFGFTREYEGGTYLETWCGTTGYAAPEMLQCQKYLGQEVDVWSLGVILYSLLTGALPFDDDDEATQKSLIIRGGYEIPDWLSSDAQDLICKIIQVDPSKRLTIPQILAHAWFTRPRAAPLVNHSSAVVTNGHRPSNEEQNLQAPLHSSMSSTASSSTYTSFHSAASDLSQSTPTTPEDVVSPLEGDLSHLHNNLSQRTITNAGEDNTGRDTHMATPSRKPPSNHAPPDTPSPSFDVPPTGSARPASKEPSSSKAPNGIPTRTPARTKRRSASSTLSAPSSPTSPTQPDSPEPPQDFISSLSTPVAIVFSTPLERELLNQLSALGLDTGQMVHSVLTDACDSSGAFWWMMRKKAERRALEDATREGDAKRRAKNGDEQQLSAGKRASPNASESFEIGVEGANANRELLLAATSSQLDRMKTPDVGVVPPSPLPDAQPSLTPPRVMSPVLLSPPQPSPPQTDMSPQQRPAFGSPNSQGSKGRGTKPRSGSVSIMQRATTALEAAGLVRKKSEEKVRREEQEKEREHQRSKDKEDKDRRATSGEDGRVSSGSSKLTKSPPFRPISKDGHVTTPESEPATLLAGLPSVTSPWVISPMPSSSHVAPTPANSPGETATGLPPSGSVGSTNGKQGRSRGSILHTFRMWFNEDRKGKRKAAANNLQHIHHHPVASPTSTSSMRGTRSKRRSSGSGARRLGHQKRPSASSRRSSSVNSRRSSIASVQRVLPEDSYNTRRRSLGARTPTSERGDFPSRPSSIQSLKVSTPGLPPPRRRSHSPSGSSKGSGRRSLRRTDSPLQRYHRRGGSGSSTRVVRQVKNVRPHVRSGSVSSQHSGPPSRPGSYHEASEVEGGGSGGRTNSPYRTPSRQSNEETPRRASYSTTVLVAKKQTPFKQPSLGRSSWKKAWGVEPPGWKSRSTEAPFEILYTDDPRTSVRDVFSGRQSLNLGDEDDWVDEDDDIPFASGLGQVSVFAQSLNPPPPGPPSLETFHKPEPFVLSAPPARSTSSRPSPAAKRSGARTGGGRQKGAHSPVVSTSPLPSAVEHAQPESRGGRRQLPGRAEPAFRHAIQEEDEDEEEE